MGGSPTRSLMTACVVKSFQLSMPNPALPSRDITTELMSQVCNNIRTESTLQPLSKETLTGLSSNAWWAWGLPWHCEGWLLGLKHCERAYFNVRVCNINPFAPSNSSAPLASTYCKHEFIVSKRGEPSFRAGSGTLNCLQIQCECKRDQTRFLQPLVLSATDKSCLLLATWWKAPYSTIEWCISFNPLCSSIRCLTGHRLSSENVVRVCHSPVNLVHSEVKIAFHL